MKKIGFMGGTFNPLHKGHIALAQAALMQYSLDEVWFVPTGNPPHKSIKGNTTRIQRIEMARMALSKTGESRFLLKEIETASSDYSYSYLTLEKIHLRYPDLKIYFIMGEDSLDYFENWVRPADIVKHADILVAVRTSSVEVIEDKLKAINSRMGKCFYPLYCPRVDISSTEIREQAKKGTLTDTYISKDIIDFIYTHRLYMEDKYAAEDLKPLKKQLKKLLKKTRYEHTLGVMDTAASLAMCYGYPMYTAMVAGLLHDCAKYMDDEELLKYAKKNHIELTEYEIKAPHLIHAKAGAYMAEKVYGVTDKDILSAIRFHTTGRPDMNLLEKIIFVADYIEPNRNQAPRLAELRQLAFSNMDLCIALILKDTIEYVNQREIPLDLNTEETFEYYKNRTEEEIFS